MTNKHSFNIPYMWQFIDEDIAGVGAFAAIAVSDDEAQPRNLAIKFHDGRAYFSIMLYKESWDFPKDEEVSVKIDLFDDKPETLAGYGDGKTLDVMLPISAAPLFLYQVATSEAMEVSLPGRDEEPWLLNLMFAGPVIQKMIRRLMGASAPGVPLNEVEVRPLH